ncbi:MAG: linked oxidase domain protein [Acidimicrobiales bacterium]|nr:linked oxidase domain protein [Acidimicrobiales bacterium]
MKEFLTGWGRTAPTPADVVRPTSASELPEAAAAFGERGLVARGLGRSYGDAAQNAGGLVVQTTSMDRCQWIDPVQGVARLDAGLSLDALLRWGVPQGWFSPVSPGTRLVTIGGAIAADVHGKNHHSAGSFGNHVRSIDLLHPAKGEVVTLNREDDAELFWATVGGMGLTGVIVSADVQLSPIETALVQVDTERCTDLGDVMARMEARDHEYPYSVAWLDLLATGRNLGRSVLTRGSFAPLDRLPARRRHRALAFDPVSLGRVPRPIPSGLLNPVTIRTFNEFWYRKAPRIRRGELQSIPKFWHPLDGVADWNRLYGTRGLLQWQPYLPFGQEEVLRSIIETFAGSRYSSFLTVLKRFGEGNAGHLSFPAAGWTLNVDLAVPAHARELADLLDRLDEQVAEAGGRIYLAKDSRLRPETFRAMYPRLAEWQEVRDRADPGRTMQSDLSRRLGLVDA